jgi:hypothetical protein
VGAANQSTPFTQTNITKPPATDQPFRSLELPKELRCMVYAELVTVGKVLFGLHKASEEYRTSPLTILRANKKSIPKPRTYTSTATILCSRLYGHIAHPSKAADTIRLGSATAPLFSAAALTKVRHVSVAITNRMNIEYLPNIVKYHGYYTMTFSERMENAHNSACDNCNSGIESWTVPTRGAADCGSRHESGEFPVWLLSVGTLYHLQEL